MTQQQRPPLQYFQGSIGQQEDKNTSVESGSKPYKRLELLGADGSSRLWVSAYPKENKMLLAQPQALWNVGYSSWTAGNGTVIHTAKDVSMISNSTLSSLAHQQQPVQQQPVAEVAPQVVREINGEAHWSDDLINRHNQGLSIIRQVAFKDVENKDNKTPEELARLTDLYESIILDRFVPDTGEEEYTQQEF